MGVRPTTHRGRLIELTLAALLITILLLDHLFPPPIPTPQGTTVVTARDGTPLRQWPGDDGQWRQVVAIDDVSPLYLQALLAYEDRWFHWHPGVNPVALARAAWQYARHGRVVSGGSTLTMQVARLVDPPADHSTRTVPAKLRQIARALQLEARLSKQEILTLYLNHAPMGGIVEGVEMAARGYLGKSSRVLSHAEAALLVALPQAPSRWRPDRHAQEAQAARDKVLARMATLGVWSAATVADARIEPVIAQGLRARWLAPLAAQRARAQRALGNTSATVATTIDPELQATIESMLLDRVHLLPPKVSMAVLVIDNDHLDVLAYAGSADFGDRARSAHVDMVRGVRSPGSTLKPFLYAMALDEGLIHSESLLIDAPQSFGGYEPGNFQATFNGPVSVSEALQKSLNVPAVDLLDRIGAARFAATLRAGGLKLRTKADAAPNLSLILGGSGTTLEELVGAYRALARGGLAGRPRLSPTQPLAQTRLMSEGAAFIVRDILEAGGHPERPLQEGPRRVAWKTGTSFGFRDAWAVGVTDRHTVGVWVGRPDGTPNPGFFGANVAAPLVHDVVAALPPSGDEAAPRTRPKSVSAAAICWPLGQRVQATPPGACRQQRTGWVLEGTAPPTLPDRYRTGGLAAASPACRDGATAHWPLALAPWVGAPACDDAGSGVQLRITGVADGARVTPVPGRTSVSVSVHAWGGGGPAAAQGGVAAETVHWLVDGRHVTNSRIGQPVTMNFARDGLHRITALTASGRHDGLTLRVAGAAAPVE